MFENESNKALNITEATGYLASVVSTFGYLPENSLLVQGIHDGMTTYHLRVDLPDLNHTGRVLAMVRDATVGNGSEAIMIGVYDDHKAPNGAQALAPLVSEIAAELELFNGPEVVMSWYVGAEDMFRFNTPEASSNVTQVVTEICDRQLAGLTTESMVTPAQRVERFSTVEAPEFADLLDEARAADLDAAQVLTVWESALERITKHDPILPSTLATLAVSLERTKHRDAVMVLAAGDRPAAGAIYLGSDAPQHERAEKLRLGLTGQAPNWAGIDALAEILAVIISGLKDQGKITAQSYTVMNWVEWTKGRGSIGGEFGDKALEIDPTIQLPRMLDVMGVCRWAAVREHSWGQYKIRRNQ
ncbi:DUF4192 family protein [Nesterenkonia lutea]|uniref:DUF4192 domain-containing protein n=1 Tax=Nesterenkonia lutea TaxID=272919 RepID=A0ABR9JHW0_9MICC|nr:DUF4192 family protein [Nesterenkonia lutea]MBE1525517.1 hypothetical protein [Nesterenkonia lutea]